jgi:hypothetical protein
LRRCLLNFLLGLASNCNPVNPPPAPSNKVAWATVLSKSLILLIHASNQVQKWIHLDWMC